MNRIKKYLEAKGYSCKADLYDERPEVYEGITIHIRENEVYFSEDWNVAIIPHRLDRSGVIYDVDDFS